MIIKSSINDYSVHFNNHIKGQFNKYQFLIVDSKVYGLYHSLFENFNSENILQIDANEFSKNFDKIGKYISFLIERGLKRGNEIAAIGGGIIQDISGFVCSILYRGIIWDYYPTTLLAQCDSCIGGKTSINFLNCKNLIGNFNPPRKITISPEFLNTLQRDEIQSGIGEIIKVFFIDKRQTISQKALMYAIENSIVSKNLIKNSLNIKRRIIEVDEFDKGLRNIMNYGHTFGHAIESITNYRVPHGIAVGIGIAIANQLSEKINQFNLHKQFSDITKAYLAANNSHVNFFKSV